MLETNGERIQGAAPEPRPGNGLGSAGSSDGPALIWDTLWAFGKTRALEAAVARGLFDQIAAGKHTVEEIADGARVSPRGARMLLDVTASIGLLEKTANRYDLTDAARTFLVSTSPAFMGGLIALMAAHNERWSELSNIVQTDTRYDLGDYERARREFFPKLVAELFPNNYRVSSLARAMLPPDARNRVKRVLDVAAGAAPWSLAWAVEDPEVRVTALDFGEVLPIAKQFVGRLACADRYDYVEGNLRVVELGVDTYDLVILGHICHSEGAQHSRKLIEKSARALKPGGLLLIGDMLPNDDRTGPLTSLLFGLQMLVNTEEGDLFTLAEYREWAAAAGLTQVRKLDFGPGGPDIVVATKPALSAANDDKARGRGR